MYDGKESFWNSYNPASCSSIHTPRRDTQTGKPNTMRHTMSVCLSVHTLILLLFDRTGESRIRVLYFFLFCQECIPMVYYYCVCILCLPLHSTLYTPVFPGSAVDKVHFPTARDIYSIHTVGRPPPVCPNQASPLHLGRLL